MWWLKPNSNYRLAAFFVWCRCPLVELISLFPPRVLPLFGSSAAKCELDWFCFTKFTNCAWIQDLLIKLKPIMKNCLEMANWIMWVIWVFMHHDFCICSFSFRALFVSSIILFLFGFTFRSNRFGLWNITNNTYFWS